MPSLPNFSTVFTWALYFVPVYIFVVSPLLSQLFPGPPAVSWESNEAYDELDDTTSGLNLTDDSFISLEDGVPVDCPGETAGYQVHLLSRAPLVIYIENFLSDDEADHLVDIR